MKLRKKRHNPWKPRPTSIRLNYPMRQRLLLLAKRKRRPLAWVIIEMIEQAFDRMDNPPPKDVAEIAKELKQ